MEIFPSGFQGAKILLFLTLDWKGKRVTYLEIITKEILIL